MCKLKGSALGAGLFFLSLPKNCMEELIKRITDATGITPEQAAKSIETIKDYVKEKFPMLGGAVDNMFEHADGDDKGSW